MALPQMLSYTPCTHGNKSLMFLAASSHNIGPTDGVSTTDTIYCGKYQQPFSSNEPHLPRGNSIPPRQSAHGRALPHAFWKRTPRQQLPAMRVPPLPLLALVVLLVWDKWCRLLVASLLLVLGSWLLVLLLVLPAWLVSEGWQCGWWWGCCWGWLWCPLVPVLLLPPLVVLP